MLVGVFLGVYCGKVYEIEHFFCINARIASHDKIIWSK